VILLLVVMLLYARYKLTPQGDVTLKVNDKDYTVSPGTTILNTLSNNEIFLPSACGGGGTCGMCKCQVLEGGGTILPTETGFFTRKEQQQQWRLGCQVKIREDMAIQIPEEVLGIKKWECEVVSNHNVATFIKEFVVKLPEGEKLNFKSGGYIQIDVPKIEVDFSKDIDVEEEYRDEWDKYAMWDLKMKNSEETYRAYSMANHPAEGNIVMLNIRIATPALGCESRTVQECESRDLFLLYLFPQAGRQGDDIRTFGEFFIKETKNEMVYVGGGAGMAPMRSHIFHLFHTLKTNRKVSYWYGARSKREIFYEEHFRAIEKEFPNFTFNIALSEPTEEDNWDGYTGFIHQVLYDNYLRYHEEPEEVEYYMCGPPQMNAAVGDLLYNMGVPEEMIDYDDFG
jgi:Na+-transporting NADH:ubiquinone oxidoreductase subunit F